MTKKEEIARKYAEEWYSGEELRDGGLGPQLHLAATILRAIEESDRAAWKKNQKIKENAQ